MDTPPEVMGTFTVVIPTYNRPALLLRAVESVMVQRVQAHEVIVVDNGTERIDRASLPERVRLVVAPARSGASQARNIGVAGAQSDYVAFLDDDDYWHEGYIEAMQFAVQRQPQVALFAGALHDSECKEPVPTKNQAKSHDLISLVRRNPGFVGSNLVVERSVYLRLGGFDSKLLASEDTDLVIRHLESGGEVLRVPEAIAYYDASHEHVRLSNVANLVDGKRVLVAKHVRNPLKRVALVAEYTARLLLAKYK